MMSLKISQSSQENTYARVSFLIKLSVNFAKFLKTPFLIEHLWRTASKYHRGRRLFFRFAGISEGIM